MIPATTNFVAKQWQHLGLDWNTIKSKISRLNKPKDAKGSDIYQAYLSEEFHIGAAPGPGMLQ